MITLTTTYKTELPSDLVEIIDNLVEDGQLLEDVLTTYDYFGEEYAKNLEQIIEVLDDTGMDRSDLYDFVEEHGVDNLEYFEKYSELCDDHDPAAVNAYISLNNYVSCVDSFEDNYRGQFDSHREFIEDLMDSYETEIPGWIHIDYDSTWECELRHEYDEEDGYYFDK